MLIPPVAGAQATTQTFTYTGTAQTFKVPSNVYGLKVLAIGGSGGYGGIGASVTSEVPVTPGESLRINVGGNGGTGPNGGYNGGGAGGRYGPGGESHAGGGGGATEVGNVIVAGGGGGEGTEEAGGFGGEGGAAEQPGGRGFPATGGGGGAERFSGGAAGTGCTGQNIEPAKAGRRGEGGNGADAPETRGGSGGGGGGGYYGGGGGGSSCAVEGQGGGGGGGSSLVPEGGELSFAFGPEVQIAYTPSVFTQQGPKLTASGEVGAGKFGRSVAVSADGNTALIAGSADSANAGAVWVFTRSGSTWTQQAKLAGGGETGAAMFGASVALSSDGNTAVIGGEEDNTKVGAVWVFTRSGSTWTQQGAKLTAGGETGKGKFGTSVTLSSDGNTALIGGGADNGSNGAVWAFTRSGSTWTQQGEKLTGGGEIGKGKFGASVALSTDGNTALIGGSADNINVGAAWAFTRSGSTWAQQGSKLTGSGEVGEGGFGVSVDLSSDGSTALIGAQGDNALSGAAWVFVRSGSTWTQQGAKLTGNGEVGTGHFGQSLSLSSDGNTALIGAYGDEKASGAVFEEKRSGTTWTQAGTKLVGSESSPSTQFGTVALSADASTAVVGGPGDHTGIGAAWIFENSLPIPTVLSVSPNSGPEETHTTVTITGSHLGQAAVVKFGSTYATGVVVNSPTSITATAPRGSGTVDVTVTTIDSTSPTGSQDQFTYIPLPAVTTVSPNFGSGGGGTVTTITGTGLSGASAVRFGASNATSFTVNGPNSITATAPPGSGLVDVTVTTAGGTSRTGVSDRFSYLPVVLSLSPISGPPTGGTSVTISGSNFNEVSTVRFGSTNAASFSMTSSTSITAVSPAGSGTVDVTVTTPGGTSATTPGDQFNYEPPTITGIKPSTGRAVGGTTVTITGTHFSGATAVKFGATDASSFSVRSETSIKAVSPAETTGTVDITVSTPKGISALTPADRYKFGAPTVTKLSPNSGSASGGTNVSITGTGFALGTGTTVFKFGTAVAGSVNCASTNACMVTAPPHAAGLVDVKATVSGQSSLKVVADQYTYN